MRVPYRGIGARAVLAVAGVAVAAAALGACGSSGSSTTTTSPSSSTSSTLSASQKSQLSALLPTLADLPAGWTTNPSPQSTSTAGVPPCLAGPVELTGSSAHLKAAYIAPSTSTDLIGVLLVSAGEFPAGAAAASNALEQSLMSCNGQTITSGESSALLTVAPVTPAPLPAGTTGFASQVTLSEGSQHNYLVVIFVAKGDHGLMFIFASVVPTTTELTTIIAKAAARL